MFRRLGTRQRAILGTFIIAGLSFLLISPTIRLAYEYLMPPSEVSNITITKTSVGEIDIKWKRNDEYDIKGYRIEKDGMLDSDVDSSVDNSLIGGLDQLKNYSFSISAYDESNKISNATQFRYSDVSDILILNSDKIYPFALTLLLRGLAFFLVLFVLTAWILFYKFSKKNVLNIVFLPATLLIPYLLLSISTIETISSISNKLLVSSGLSIIIAVVGYISLLTTNILNAAMQNRLPLEQAGKAIQFIMALISTYLILIYAFGSFQNIFIRLIVLVPFIFIYTYQGLSINRASSYYVARLKSIGISLIVWLSALVASVWPVEVAYSILMIAIIYYILLNLALEVRTRYTRALWVEYIVLICLIVLLFFTTSSWGINFSVI